jgi:hypothetical protein
MDIGVSAAASSRCGSCILHTFTALFTSSAIVSVAEVKIGGDWLQPIGKANGNPINGSSPGRIGSRTPSFATSADLTQIR